MIEIYNISEKVCDTNIMIDKFEYKLEAISNNISLSQLNDYGKEGWELILMSREHKHGKNINIVEYNRSWGFETLTYQPTENFNSERNNQAGTRPQFWLYCVIGRLFIKT